MAVVIPVGVFFTYLKKLAVVFVKRLEMRYRHKKITSLITNFIFNITLFMTFIGICEHSLETIMLFKAIKSFSCHAPTTSNNFGDNCLSIIEPYLFRYNANVFENAVQSFKETFHVFAIKQLQIAFITVRK